jgi:Sec-independent protein translocase protein TatA
MPSMLFILLIAFLIFGPRKLPEIVTNILPTGQPWKKLMRLITESVSPGSQELVSTSESSAEPPKPAIALIEPSSSLVKSVGGE